MGKGAAGALILGLVALLVVAAVLFSGVSTSTSSAMISSSTTRQAAPTTMSTTSTAKPSDIAVTQIAVQLVVRVQFLGIDVSKQNFKVTLSGFQTETGSVENYNYTFQNTTGVSGEGRLHSVSTTTQGFSDCFGDASPADPTDADTEHPFQHRAPDTDA